MTDPDADLDRPLEWWEEIQVNLLRTVTAREPEMRPYLPWVLENTATPRAWRAFREEIRAELGKP